VKIRRPVFAVGDDKKKGKGRKGITQFRVIFQLYGERTPWTDFYENWQGGRSPDVIILSIFGFNTFTGFRSTGGQNFHLPIDFAGHRYNSAAATAQPVMATGDVKAESRIFPASHLTSLLGVNPFGFLAELYKLRA